MAQFNLVIFQTPGLQHVSDFMSARNMMFARAPDITVHILSRGADIPAGFWPRLAEHPTLLFSPLPRAIDDAVRGARAVARSLTKLKEIELFAKAGFPVPNTQRILPEAVFDERQWGPFLVLKPNKGMRGEGIRLTRTRDARWVDPLSWPQGHPRHGVEILAQQFIDPGPFSRCYRVFTVLGRAVYANTSTATEGRPLLDPDGAEPVDLDVAANGDARRIELSEERDVIELAERIHAHYPHIPAMGLDFIRQDRTGALFVLEMNSHGRTWHLSSNYGLLQQRMHGVDYYGQFNALKILADAFIDATRRLAK